MDKEKIRAILNSAFEGCIWQNASGDSDVNDCTIEGKEEFFNEVIRQLDLQEPEIPGKLDIWKADQ